mgnify:CR=1 FL=1
MGHSPYLICDEQGERIKSAAPNLIPSGALWVSPFSPMSLRNIGETPKKQSFLRYEKTVSSDFLLIRYPTNYRLSKFNRITPCFFNKIQLYL